MRKAYSSAITNLIAQNKNVICITADGTTTEFKHIIEMYPDQFHDFGICESNIVGISAGLSLCGKIPFFYTIAPFLVYRSYEFIRLDVCMQNLNVKLIGNSSGISNSFTGPTHQTTEDIAILRVLPNIVILSPATPIEAYHSVCAASKHSGPVYIRLGKNGERELYDDSYEFKIGKGNIIRNGNDITIISTGGIISEVIDASDILVKHNISVNIINMSTIKPIDENIVLESVSKTKNIITIEEHSVYGGLGGAVAELLSQNEIEFNLKTMGLTNFVKGYGDYDDVKDENGLTSNHIVNTVLSMLK